MKIAEGMDKCEADEMVLSFENFETFYRSMFR